MLGVVNCMSAKSQRVRAKPAEAVLPRITAGGGSSSSWLALLAATTFGFGAVNCVRTEVLSAGDLLVKDKQSYRLVVQSYAPGELVGDQFPSDTVRPLASAQRAVTAEELRRGVAVQMVQLDEASEIAATPNKRVLAWIEPGQPDLEFDARTARPSSDAVYGFGELQADAARVVLRRRTGREG